MAGKRPDPSEPVYNKTAEAKEHGDAHTHEQPGVKSFDAPDKQNSNARVVLVGVAVPVIIAGIWVVPALIAG